MRIDRFLYFIRFAKSRSVAQGLVDAGYIRVDGKRVAKHSEGVAVGSTVALPFHDRARVIRVLAIPNRRGPAAEARLCYEELGIDEPKPAT